MDVNPSARDRVLPGVLSKKYFERWDLKRNFTSSIGEKASVMLCFATTQRAANQKAERLRQSVMDAYEETCGIPPRDHRFTIKVVSCPEIGPVRTEYGSINFIVCFDRGLEVYNAERWLPVPVETSTRGIVLAGGLHPTLPATRYRVTESVSSVIIFSVEPQFKDREPSRYDCCFDARIENLYEKSYQQKMSLECDDYVCTCS